MILGEQLETSFYKAIHLIFRSKTINGRRLTSTYFSLLAFVDDLSEYSFSFGMYLPPMVSWGETECHVNALIIERNIVGWTRNTRGVSFGLS